MRPWPRRRRASVRRGTSGIRELAAQKKKLDQELDDRVEALEQAEEVLVKSLTALRDILSRVEEVESPPQGIPVVAPKPHDASATPYIVSARFLYDSFQLLMPGEPEWMHYVTGVRVGDVLTLDRVVEFELEKQSATYVSGDEAASRDALIDMETFGQALHASFHSHRMVGRSGVRPSGTDLKHQERLEHGRYPVISAIFSEDGYIGFFSVKRNFSINVYGKGVERVDDNVFKLTSVSAKNLPTGEGHGTRRSVGDRSDGTPAGLRR